MLGANIVADLKGQTLVKYDFGANITPTDNATIGIKHESTNKNALSLGRFWFYFFHAASARNTVGSEISLDCSTMATAYRIGWLHAFDDDTSAKIKVNHEGRIDGVLKHKLSKTTTACFVTGTNIKEIAQGKSTPLPLGLSFDVKF